MTGCGFDFKLVPKESNWYFGVEVKGIHDARGTITLTNKEYTVASLLKNRYFLFVVKNFKENPLHNIYQDPISSVNFKRLESKITQISWNATV